MNEELALEVWGGGALLLLPGGGRISPPTEGRLFPVSL